ncbi:hypothetical protein OH76DRAFT_1479864 [Lentinus brumalis]|uniref:F-box domain-containing protein n=1 Tax=Lentinus brumalis TaxID=2498619 RepID=A0A371DLM0_9APHY|nr:hypothetical protein OH76DRAFT_1479864 [Polyporus brumalis]
MLLALRIFLAGRPILPSLCMLELASTGVRREHSYLEASATILLAPSVNALSLIPSSHGDWLEEVLFDVLTRTRQVTPHLQSLYIDYLAMPNIFPEGILSAAICSFHHLQSFSADRLALSSSALIHLARLPGLRVLRALLKSDQVAILQEAATTSPLFPALRDIALKERNAFADALALLNLITSSELRSIDFEVVQPEDDFAPLTNSYAPGAVEVFRAIGTREHNGAVTFIRVSAGTWHSRLPGMVTAITEATLLPLYALSALRDLVVHINCDFDIEDATISRMARGWPLLRRLEFGFDDLNRNEHEPTVSFSCIASLAGACPHLESLRIGVDTSTVAHARSQDVRPPVSDKLTRLEVGWSVMGDPVAVAGFLSESFPRLRKVHHAWLTEEDFGMEVPEEYEIHGELWSHVDILLPQFAKIREQERNWAKG